MILTVSNEITIEQPTREVTEYCKSELVINNPDYAKKQRMGLWLGRTPAKLYLYRTRGDAIICPYGALKDIKAIIGKATIKQRFTALKNVQYNADMHLYSYQQDAVDAMCAAGGGILQSAAGSGKTQCGIGIINALGVKALWLTHTVDLLRQSYDRAVQCGISEDLLGTITAGKVNIGAGITFATVQTLAKLDLSLYKDEWDCIIVDECHRCAGTPTAVTQFSAVLNGLAAPYKYGLSATVHRADGLIKTTFALLGPVAHTVPDSAVAGKTMQARICPIGTGFDSVPFTALDTDGTIIYSKLITEIANNWERNVKIASYVEMEYTHYNLILSDRLDQLRELCSLLPPKLQEQAAIIDGKTAKAEREQAIEDMRAGKKHFLFASYKLAKEGLDIPRLDRLHLATPQKDYAVIVQSVGRVARAFDGKDEPVVYDYVDGIGLLQNMYKQRCRAYRKINCKM